ncbi:protein YceG like [Streptococcus mitis]|nr:protein YceG like [Streptococcus mitis]
MYKPIGSWIPNIPGQPTTPIKYPNDPQDPTKPGTTNRSVTIRSRIHSRR